MGRGLSDLQKSILAQIELADGLVDAQDLIWLAEGKNGAKIVYRSLARLRARRLVAAVHKWGRVQFRRLLNGAK